MIYYVYNYVYFSALILFGWTIYILQTVTITAINFKVVVVFILFLFVKFTHIFITNFFFLFALKKDPQSKELIQKNQSNNKWLLCVRYKFLLFEDEQLRNYKRMNNNYKEIYLLF